MTADAATSDGSVVRSRVRVVGLVGGLFVLSAAAGAYEISPASVLPVVRETLGIGPTAAGWLVSVMYLTAVVTSVPTGLALDRVPARSAVAGAGVALLVAGAWGWVAATGGDYWSLVASRALGGLAYIVVWNAGAAVVGEAVGPDLRATAVGGFTASAPAGFVLGQFGSPLIAGALGWPAILPAFAAIAAVGLVAFLLAGGDAGGVGGESPDLAAIGRLFANRRTPVLYVLCFLAFALYLFLNSWLPSYVAEELGESLATAGVVTALLPAAGIAARTGGGVVSDRLFGGRRRPVILLAFGVATPAVLGFLALREVALVVGLVVVAGLGVQLAIGLLFSLVGEVVEDAVTTTAISVLTACGLSGALVGPIAGGAVIAWAGYGAAFAGAGAVALLGFFLALWAPDRA